MALTVKSSYALRALFELALLNKEGIKKVSIAELSKRQQIPRDFLEKIFSELRDAGILKSIRGRYGGYVLLKDPKDLRLSEIVNVLDKPLQSYDCVSGECRVEIDCAVEFVWKRVHNVMMLELDKMTLQDIIRYGKEISKLGSGDEKNGS
ncbi:Rrf2 family transcriptional regulator [Oceanotoga sp. DSM 15011]|jgi:Rrf2 family iron-sulfur cluster assembly transcriptional regulator|uniref:BadM/Rrf2 family transcriptional regulator n=1 Tax=Oceanotoga teriensis TaxID=515440 RepID=A0AA45HJP9_9BACT|nr:MULTISPECIES: Rrf2 family transcriptional regulator [Oceanotoga]MDN5342387.1 Rrf2 family transcriptional regulator, iron-sulfur cluster assembly transcription factor [Oceanotoga sp.]MDO7975532.1 Rrf2 family transcriptional regulator [Oceanotoga teriensis]PWJ96180.1 BadM/Rrf2 family transcriptional regulator [Oceanotoga teriensis]UYO99963.1 Rrf2 family transcriptional regulator [Oceanotoga sp. DSM 15011]